MRGEEFKAGRVTVPKLQAMKREGRKNNRHCGLGLPDGTHRRPGWGGPRIRGRHRRHESMGVTLTRWL